MQTAKSKAEAQGRKAKLALSYQQLLDEFASNELQSVGNYTLGRLIGKGSFGKVYLATHKLTNGSKVVLKSAHKDDSNLAREIHHHRQFVHPHIARLYEVIVTESLVWMVLEYCPGDELYNYLLEHGPLPVNKIQKIFAQLVGAVCYVHRQSCVHRDLKLENILFDRHENVKLVDFGFTREYEGRTNHLQTFCGTICYAAPEMLRGEKYAGEKVDVWSLGIILYALLCGELPFDDDNDNVTRKKILSEDPRYPDHLPSDAVPLLKALLSKRPFPRPSLQEILNHGFLSEHAPAQRAILDIEALPPFSRQIEKDCLLRMRSAGIETEAVIESVQAQKCDALSGWWTLLLEKEERKMQRRDRKRKETDKGSRRLSAASSRLERLFPTLHDVDTDGNVGGQFRLADLPTPKSRGRSERRSTLHLGEFSDLPQLTEANRESGATDDDDESPPTPIDKDSIRSVSTSCQRRPIPPPKEGVIRSARSRGSTLHLVTTSDTVMRDRGGNADRAPPTQDVTAQQKAKKKPSQVIVAHWKHWTHWFIENTTRRRKGHERRTSRSTPNLHHAKEVDKGGDSADASPRPQTSKYPAAGSPAPQQQATAPLPKGVVANGHVARGQQSAAAPVAQTRGGAATVSRSSSLSLSTPNGTVGLRPILGTASQSPSYNSKRQSLSPSPLTPRSSTMRRGSVGLRGRKSTSSSVSSVRSMHHAHHHQHSHSKASSTSSAGSVSTSKTPHRHSSHHYHHHHHHHHSPHHSVKVLPATPTTGSAFPANIRLVLGQPSSSSSGCYDEGMPGSPSPFGGVLFARRRRSLFKGPRGAGAAGGGAAAGSSSSSSVGRRSGELAAAAARGGDRSGEIIQEEEEDADGMLEEEVDAFVPVVEGPGERVEEHILEP